MNHTLSPRRPFRTTVAWAALTCGVLGLAKQSLAHEEKAVGIRPVSMQDVCAQMTQAADAFYDALTPEQQKKASYQFADDERLNWHFIPKTRNGLPFKEMTPSQQRLATALISTALSSDGLRRVEQIMSLEDVLKTIEAGPPKSPVRDSELYFVTLFGKPGEGDWGWRLEGHHLSMNVTVIGGKAVVALPTFLGSNPGEVREGPRKGLRVLAEEEDLGRKLVQSLTQEQQAKAIISKTAPKDIITAAERKIDMAKVIDGKAGLAASEMQEAQRELLLQLVELYARRHRAELADQSLRKIHVAGFDKVQFAWAGGTEPGVGHYYRISGPTFLVEYDNTQNNANHVHTVWRDPADDFGEDLLKKHYEDKNSHHDGSKAKQD